jgi:teichuronic acid biosynthesis glycosyltransferase TuaC
MRIAVVTTSYPSFDGDPSGHFVEAEVAALTAAGHHVDVIRPAAGRAFGWPGFASRVRERPSRSAEALRWVARARRQIASGVFDRVVAHWALPSAWPIALAQHPDRTLETVSHGGDVRLLRALPSAARAHVVSRILARGRWRFVSEPLRDALATSLPAPLAATLRERSWVEPPTLGIAHDVKPAARARRGAFGEREVYVSAGRLVASKRVESAVAWVAERARAARELGVEAPKLVVVGDGPERARLASIARALDVDADFVGATTRPEALSWIGAADALLFASRAEGLSTVVREAEALGVRVQRV